jgi:hypothetical protein
MRQGTLERLQRAFLDGRHRPPSNAYSAAGRVFATHFRNEVSNHVSAKEFAAIETFWQRQGQALAAARRMELDQSCRAFRETRSALEQSGLSIKGAFLVQTLLDPAEAYLHYQQNDYRCARQLVLSGVSINRRLTDEFGVGILSAQRMQLFHNLLRIATREGRRDDTIRLAAIYLNYLEHDCAPLPDDIAWAEINRDFPDSIVQFYFDQVCGEAALALIGDEDPRSFARIASHLAQACSPTFAPHGHLWMAVTQHRFQGQIDEYLNGACSLLEPGKTAEPSIWLGTVFDVAAVCRKAGPPGQELAAFIYREMSSLPDARWIFESMAIDHTHSEV